jgi:fructose-1,6-bisphosphatase I
MITTFQQHILQQQREVLYASRDFSWLLSGITLAAKMIEAKIRCAGLCNIVGTAGQTNVQGETQQKLDVFANAALLHCLGVRDSVATLISEENDEPVTFGRDPDTGKYVIVFDPLDGSSNIDVNVNVGTIFSIYKRKGDYPPGGVESVLQPGSWQLAAGYVLYGPSTVLGYRAGRGVYGFRSIRRLEPLS